MTNATKLIELNGHYDIVGSFLRTQPVRNATEQYNKGELSWKDLNEVRFKEIEKLVKKQKEVGLKIGTSGEFDRHFWHLDFIWYLGGVSHIYTPEAGFIFKGTKTPGETARLTSKLYDKEHPFIEIFKALKLVADKEGVIAKQTIPAPVRAYTLLTDHINEYSVAHFYKSHEEFADDLVLAYKKVINDLYDAGCRYLQLDDTTWCNCIHGHLNDHEFEHRHFSEKDGDLNARLKLYRELNNKVLEGLPSDLIIATHTCRGNFQSSYTAEGPYDLVIDELVKENFDAFFLEYESDRAGTFDALKHFPKDKVLVAGIFSSKFADLEDKGVILKKVEEILKYVDKEHLALSTQCGWASCEEGNLVSEDQQWKKQEYIKSIVDEIFN
ncbi:MAG: 5-methyltetrahydropteroyltriglutamate--homocysteine S-methyltransferase [Rickettsiales bacterium]|nr:MAG: 5-methyltetrahydropteroyltriglutamate--homocysteine S-methyltransferase [Rickettsiales bacterium]